MLCVNGGPGSPAFAYVASNLQSRLEQPVWGWMGAGDVFGMADGFIPSIGMRRFISGTPPIVGMLAMQDMLDLVGEVGIDAIRVKSLALTDYALALVDEILVPLGVAVATPRDHEHRGGHVTIRHSAFKRVKDILWSRDILPDFRNPDGIRLGLSPLSTTFAELRLGIVAIGAALQEVAE